MKPRKVEVDDLDELAALWFTGWWDAHGALLPETLARHRTQKSFRQRLEAMRPDIRVLGAPGHLRGFSFIEGQTLDQLFVAPSARGTGVAAELLHDAETRLAERGVAMAWLACAIGNLRAARFYAKHGWRYTGDAPLVLETPEGALSVDIWRYEKALPPAGEVPPPIDQRPLVGVAHVVLETDCMSASARFMRMIGTRPIFEGDEVSVHELRGGTHLILMKKGKVAGGDAAFDLMVDDLHAAHRQFSALGLDPSPIESRPEIDHEVFRLREPAGHTITVFSSHVSSRPV